MQFSEEQRAAIAVDRYGEDACIVAGPGSGKTTVLVERFRQLVADRGISPRRILAITFTEKAASNMREKLARELGTILDTANVSTVHGFCYRLIREHAIEAGVDPGASILDEGRGVVLRERALEKALDELLEEQPEAARSLMRGLCADARNLGETYEAVRSAGVRIERLRDYRMPQAQGSLTEIDELMAQVPALSLKAEQRGKIGPLLDWHRLVQCCVTPMELRKQLQEEPFRLSSVRHPGLSAIVKRIRELAKAELANVVTAAHAEDRNTLITALERFDRIYSVEKRRRGWLDFSDLEFYAVHLLETHPHVCAKLREQFEQIMMDEFQDVNGQQEKLMTLLRGTDRFYAVGDINQSIYGFRYSSPEVFRRYRDEVQLAAKHYVDMKDNWRSRPDVLLAVEAITDTREGIERRQLRAAKQWPAKRVPSVEVIAVEAPEDVNGTEIEAAWVAQRMLEMQGELKLRDSRAAFRDMAVLVRNSSVFEAFAQAFERANIPYEQSRRRGFLDTRPALDLMHLLRTIANPRDEISLAAVLRSPFVALSDEGILLLKTWSKYNLAEGLYAFTAGDSERFEERDRARILAFRTRLEDWRSAAPYIALHQLLLRAIDEADYPYRPGTLDGGTIDRFLGMARTADAPVQEFVEELERLREVDTGDPETPLDSGRDAVRMMTAHSAKGLEFPIVFVASMNKGTRNTSPAFSFTPEIGLGAKWRTNADDEGQDDHFQAANLAVIKEREKQESSRLLYVALTRAEEHLVLSYSKERDMHWAGRINELFVKPFEPEFGKPGVLQIAAPDGRTFSARVVRTAQLPTLAEQGSFLFDEGGGVDELRRPAIDGQYDSAVTVTAVATFADCPRKFYLAHQLGWEQRRPVRLVERGDDFEAGAIPASELGREVHRLLAGEEIEATLQSRALADAFLGHELGERTRRSSRVEREWGFLVAVEDVVVSGQVDLWFVENDGIVLVDYKTNAVDRDGAAEAALAYTTQVQLYALALERATGLGVTEAYLHFLHPNEAIRVECTSGAAERAVMALRDAQEDGDFPLRVAERCRRCAFYHNHCPAETFGAANSSMASPRGQ